MFLLTCLLRGMTLQYIRSNEDMIEFLLTCLLRGMTHMLHLSIIHILVSTHMPLARHDM